MQKNRTRPTDEKRTAHPPKWASRLLAFYCRPELLEDLQGDLTEMFERNLRARGRFMARLIYIIDVLKFARSYTIRKPKLSNPFGRQLMLANYIKTSGRVIGRNKLFSGINIVGLAVSMSVGLLVIAVVSDLDSYDKFLKDRDRIYRIVTTMSQPNQPPMKLASTSWRAGELISKTIPGIESITILRRGFDGDAKVGGNTVPVGGWYADEGFLKVLSFPLVEGSAATALKEPHSVVLTQTTSKKLFGAADPMGRVLTVDTVNYTVTGVLEDLPKFSHLQFELLASLSSINLKTDGITGDGHYMDWSNAFSNYVYVLLSKSADPSVFSAALNRLSERENAADPNRQFFLSAQPVKSIAVGSQMANDFGLVMPSFVLYILAGLALIILLSACFNYTNLSIARSLKRSREVGIRKVIGAQRGQVIGQFIAESIVLSLLSLVFAFCIFLLLRGLFFSIDQRLQNVFSLDLSPGLVLDFVGLAAGVGLVAGLLPALFYSKIKAVQVLKDASAIKVFRYIPFRKVLVVTQYTFSLIFITSTILGYYQYKHFIRLDLGFTTTNVLNIDMQGNKDAVFVRELAELPAVKMISRSLMVSSLGSISGETVKYGTDSVGVYENVIDEGYLPLHQYTFLAGRNYMHRPKDTVETEVIVNERLIKRFDIGHGNPEKAIGNVIAVGNKQLTIIGVLRDFHYGTVDREIDPTILRYSAEPGRFVNVKMTSENLPATMATIESSWKQIDKVHPLDAKFYDEQIERAYRWLSVMLEVVGIFAALAICISSLGLFGMVLYTMERRVKEVSIRKVLGAGESILVYLLSKGFVVLLGISALIALPVTWLFFEKVLLSKIPYHEPIHFGELFTGLFIVAGIAFLMIGVQTLKIVRANPATVLKNE